MAYTRRQQTYFLLNKGQYVTVAFSLPHGTLLSIEEFNRLGFTTESLPNLFGQADPAHVATMKTNVGKVARRQMLYQRERRLRSRCRWQCR
jgi:hypothetical protein